jgi:hypothetical protein
MDTEYDSLWVRIVSDATTKLAGFIVCSIGAMFRTMGRLLASRIPGPGRYLLGIRVNCLVRGSRVQIQIKLRLQRIVKVVKVGTHCL